MNMRDLQFLKDTDDYVIINYNTWVNSRYTAERWIMYTEAEVIQFINENDVKFIRLAFCDIYGRQRNISIMPTELERAIHEGVSFDASAVPGFGDIVNSDLFLIPDITTLSLLPWRPSHGRVVRFFCHIKHPDGTPYRLDSRQILREAIEDAKKQGYICNFGAECEFYLFKMDEEGNPTNEPFDQADYFAIAPEDKGENIRREICLTLEEMGIQPECSHHEEGPGQNEIDFKYSDALTAADNVITFQSVVKTLAARSGLYATFAPKPILGKPGNGFHINVSPHKMGTYENDPRDMEAFMAGVMKHIRECTCFMNPSKESYMRLGCMKAPKYISWSPMNRSQLIRVPAERGGHLRMELRSADCTSNPYIVYALLIRAGMEGIREGLKPVEPLNINLYTAPFELVKDLERLPETLQEAKQISAQSDFIKAILPQEVCTIYLGQE